VVDPGLAEAAGGFEADCGFDSAVPFDAAPDFDVVLAFPALPPPSSPFRIM
jgi:hypothetical protein